MQRKCNFLKRILTDFNSEFSFSLTGYHFKAKNPSLLYYFLHCWRENSWIHTFPKFISVGINVNEWKDNINNSATKAKKFISLLGAEM